MQLADTATTVYTTYEKIFDHRLYTTLAKDDYAIHSSMWTSDGVHYILKTTRTPGLHYMDNASRPATATELSKQKTKTKLSHVFLCH